MLIRYNTFGRPCDSHSSVKFSTPSKRSVPNLRENRHAHNVH